MIVAVVMPVVFVLWLLKNAIKILKLIVCNLIVYYFLCFNKHITIYIMLIVSWPEPKPLWSYGTPAYWVSMEKLLSWQEQLTNFIEASC